MPDAETIPLADKECDFCRIGRGDTQDVEVVCDSALWIAFFPLDPATPGHTLVIPRAHVPDVWSLDPELGSDLMAGVIRVGKAIQEAISPSGMNLISSAGEVAEQSVFHVHLHILPRYPNDGIDIWPPKKRMPDTLEHSLADAIRTACAAT